MPSAQEYDELSRLCDKLMGQQDELQAEVRQQAKIIEVSQDTAAVLNYTLLSLGLSLFIRVIHRS